MSNTVTPLPARTTKPAPFRRHFGATLEENRKRLTGKDNIAEFIREHSDKLSESFYAHERGQNLPSFDQIRDYAEIFGVPYHELAWLALPDDVIDARKVEAKGPTNMEEAIAWVFKFAGKSKVTVEYGMPDPEPKT